MHVDDLLRTSNPRIYAAGDVCLEHQFTNTAQASGRIVVRHALFFGRERISALTIPWCAFTDPEVAYVGIYVSRHGRLTSPSRPSRSRCTVNRAIADSEEDGFVEVHVREGSDRIFGAKIVVRQAIEMINNVSMAMVAGMGLRALSAMIHTYPPQGGCHQDGSRRVHAQAALAVSRVAPAPVAAALSQSVMTADPSAGTQTADTGPEYKCTAAVRRSPSRAAFS